jgi:plastin-1
MNSLGVDPFVNRLYDDLRDGRVLLQVMDRIRPGSVNWRRATRTAPMIRFKAIENTNMVVEMARAWRFSLVGIQGADITDGSRTLTLGLVWQLMRENIVATLRGLASDAQEVRDQDMVDWANGLVRSSPKGRAGAIASFKDASLKTGVFLLELLAALQPGLINRDLVTPGLSEADAKLNAKYAISAARKLGATIFCLPEDIWEVRPKLLLTFVGSLMVLQRSGGLPQAQPSQ